VTIRSFQPGDEAHQAAIYNEAAGGLPGFKPVAPEEVRRRTMARGFEPATRLYAEAGGRVVGYCAWHPNGRLSYPWCRPGHEDQAGPLFEAALAGLRGHGLTRAFAAYRGDWPAVGEFFTAHGFTKAREVNNYLLELTELPTIWSKPRQLLTGLRPDDVPALLAMAPRLFRVPAGELERHLFHNPYFPPQSVFAMRSRADGSLLGVGLLVSDMSYADPHQLDARQPCFRHGAFGAEGMQTKRVQGLFSFVVDVNRPELPALALDLMTHAAQRLEEADGHALAGQAPSDVPAVVRFYDRYFKRQGGFPVFERSLA
jgi:hypothetical protein